MATTFRDTITTVEQLREVIAPPGAPALRKQIDVIDDHCRDFIARSPFALIATSNAAGDCDVSPKGDPAGFVHVLDGQTVAIPERPGNGRVDGWRNVLENPHVGLIFMVPGRNDTLRINGRARLVRDAGYFDELAVRDRRPLLACEVDVDQVFFHCPKAFMRSELWQPEGWPAKDRLPSVAAIAKELARPDEPLEKIEEYYGETLAERLY